MALSSFTVNGFKSGWVPSNLDKYDRFRNAQMHGEDWTSGLKYFAIYWIVLKPPSSKPQPLFATSSDMRLCSPLFENGPSPTAVGNKQMGHAEKNLLDHLKFQLSIINSATVQELMILQSASPCDRCCNHYCETLGPIAQNYFPVTIAFSSFYNVRRPSCLRQNHSHFNQIDEKLSWNTVWALKRLKAANIHLETTGYNEWKLLREALQLPDTYSIEVYQMSARKREDDDLRQDLIILMRR